MFTTCSAFFSSLLGRPMTHPCGAGTVRATPQGWTSGAWPGPRLRGCAERQLKVFLRFNIMPAQTGSERDFGLTSGVEVNYLGPVSVFSYLVPVLLFWWPEFMFVIRALPAAFPTRIRI